MTTISTMQQYGRGVGRVPMPRALARDSRDEWPVSPSLMIFLLSVLIIVSLKLTMSNRKLFKVTQTIIILPQTRPAPEPTVPKNIPLIKVIKDAAKKTIEPKRKELQKIEAKKILPKPIEPIKALTKKIEPQKIEAKKIIPARPLPKIITEKPAIPKKIDLALEPVAGLPPKVVARPSTFTPLPGIQRNSKTLSAPSGSLSLHAPIAAVPTGKRPLPELTQWEAYTPPVSDGPSPTALAHAPQKATPDPKAPVRHLLTEGPATEDLVIIKSSLIGNSERVKTLKRAIMKKARNMSPHQSPYTYIIKNYTCTLVVEDGIQGKVIIDFSPAGAPFDVVSALERTLPR